MRHNSYFQTLFSLIILTGILSGDFVIHAQTSKAAKKSQASQHSNTGWSGVISYSKTLADSRNSNEPRFGTTDPKNERVKINYSRSYRFVAKLVFNTVGGTINSKTKVSLNDSEIENGSVTNHTRCHSHEPDRLVREETISKQIIQASANGPAEDFHIREGYGGYSFELRFPAAAGESSRQTGTAHTNYCPGSAAAPPARNTSQPYTIKDETLSIEGVLDPKNPDVITGSKIWGHSRNSEPPSFNYQATWRFTRRASVFITQIKFEDMKFPEWNAWKEVSDNEVAIDGNQVRIKTSVINMSDQTKFVEVRFFETYKGDKYDGARKDRALQGGLTLAPTVKLDPGEEREVEIPWYSEGYAWFDDGRPRPIQRFRAEAWETDTLRDSLTENLRVAPKPIIFVPGIWSSPEGFAMYQNLFTYSHSFDWKAEIFNRRPTSIYDNADELAEFVLAAQKKYNAWHVDMAAHSSGGLVGRLYIHKAMEVQPDRRPTVKHFMMLGTPNLGVPCADSLKYSKFDANLPTARQIAPDAMARFNQFVTERKDTHFSALAGNGIPFLCGDILAATVSDGFVSILSATYGVTDFQFTPDDHPDLVDPRHFGDFMKPHVVTGPAGLYPLFPNALRP